MKVEITFKLSTDAPTSVGHANDKPIMLNPREQNRTEHELYSLRCYNTYEDRGRNAKRRSKPAPSAGE